MRVKVSTVLAFSVVLFGSSSAAVEPPTGAEARLLIQIAELFGIEAPAGKPGDRLSAIAAQLDGWQGGAPPVDAASECPVTQAVAEAPQPRLDPNSLLPHGAERFARSLSLALELTDLPDAFLVSIPRAGETRVVGLRNTQDYTSKVTLSVKPGDFLRTTADRQAAFDAVTKASQAGVPVDAKGFTLGSDPWKEISSGAAPRRFLNGITFSAAYGQRPQFESGAQVPDFLLNQDPYQETYSVRLDPFTWFNRTPDRVATLQAYNAYARLNPQPNPLVPTFCDGTVKGCFDDWLGARRSSNALLALLPVVEWKTVDQFDYLKFNNSFYTTFEETLDVLSVTWDLGRTSNLAKLRLSALDAWTLHHQLQRPAPVISQPPPRRTKVGEFFYHRLELAAGSSETKWRLANPPAATKRSCLFPGVELLGDGLMVGYPDVAGTYDAVVEAFDPLGHVTRQIVHVEVVAESAAAAAARLAATYRRAAAEPDLDASKAVLAEILTDWSVLLGHPVD